MANRYFAIFLLFIANLFGLVYLFRFMNQDLLFKEILIMVLMIWMLAVILFNFARNSRYKFSVSALFFALGLINTIFLYFSVKSIMLVLLTAANAFGFVIAINNLEIKRKKRKQKISRIIIPVRKKEEEKPVELEKEFEEYEKERKSKERGIKKEARIKQEVEKEALALERAEQELKEALKQKKKRDELEELKREAYALERAEKKIEAIPKKRYGMSEAEELRREASLIQEAEKKLTAMKAKESIKEKFTPGKYVASRSASTYHIPKCDWANNIKKKNRVWFDSEKEARKKGYKAHSCLKKK